MKIKNIVLVGAAVLCLALSGCEIYDDYYLKDADKNASLYKPKETEELNTLFDTAVRPLEQGGLYAKQREALEQDFERADNIIFTQHSNGRAVEVYENKEYKGVYVLYDGQWLSLIKPSESRLNECDKLYESLDNTAFAPVEWSRGDNGKGVIICANREYSVMDWDFMTPFSVKYTDVDAAVENMPMKVLVYENNGRAERVELITISSPYMDKLSQENIGQVKELFDKLGFGNEAEEIALEFGKSLDKPSYKRSGGAVSVISARAVEREKEVVYNVFTVEIK